MFYTTCSFVFSGSWFSLVNFHQASVASLEAEGLLSAPRTEILPWAVAPGPGDEGG